MMVSERGIAAHTEGDRIACLTRRSESVLVIGSGPIVIGQAAEFDYAGTQACRALREEGVRTILVNSNPATIMTDEDVADAVYIEPLTPEVVRRVIQRERPDGLLPTLGGQTGLNLAVQVAELGILDRVRRPAARHAARVDQGGRGPRSSSRSCCERIGEPAIRERDRPLRSTRRVSSPKTSPLPLVIRPAYTLGGTGGGIAHNAGGARRDRRPAASTPARSARCWSSARCWAGKRSSTR